MLVCGCNKVGVVVGELLRDFRAEWVAWLRGVNDIYETGEDVCHSCSWLPFFGADNIEANSLISISLWDFAFAVKVWVVDWIDHLELRNKRGRWSAEELGGGEDGGWRLENGKNGEENNNVLGAMHGKRHHRKMENRKTNI